MLRNIPKKRRSLKRVGPYGSHWAFMGEWGLDETEFILCLPRYALFRNALIHSPNQLPTIPFSASKENNIYERPLTIFHVAVNLSLSSSQITVCQNKKPAVNLSLEVSVSGCLCVQ
jgi:hypothetical protein